MARTKPAKTRGKTSRKLKLSKETLKDLAPGARRGGQVKGGAMKGATSLPLCGDSLCRCSF
jgi:hypothetical protein